MSTHEDGARGHVQCSWRAKEMHGARCDEPAGHFGDHVIDGGGNWPQETPIGVNKPGPGEAWCGGEDSCGWRGWLHDLVPKMTVRLCPQCRSSAVLEGSDPAGSRTQEVG